MQAEANICNISVSLCPELPCKKLDDSDAAMLKRPMAGVQRDRSPSYPSCLRQTCEWASLWKIPAPATV